MDLRIKKKGEEDKDTLSAMNNLAVSLSRLGKIPEALEMERKMLDLRIKVNGE